MANLLDVRTQLHQIGFKNKYFGWSALRQLPMILERNEIIEHVVTGVYQDGYAVIVATNKRVLILDKKPMSFRAEDIHYEMISQVEHYLGPMFAKLRIRSLSNACEFTSIHASDVQSFANHVDRRVNKIRLNMQNVRDWSQMLDSGVSDAQAMPEAVAPALGRPVSAASASPTTIFDRQQTLR